MKIPDAGWLRAAVAVVSLAGASPSGFGQSPEQSAIAPGPIPESFLFSWTGQADRTYFVQLSTDLMEWEYVPIIETGDGALVEWGFETASDRVFLRLAYKPFTVPDPGDADFDGDGLSNWDEILRGTDPLAAADLDGDGTIDDIAVAWAEVPVSWKQAFVDDPEKFVNDPDNRIDAVEKILPTGDYDGDGVANLAEYLRGTDPTDFYDGNAPLVFVIAGNYQRVAAGGRSRLPLVVLVLDADENKLTNAPVVFSVPPGSGFVKGRADEPDSPSRVVRTSSPGRTLPVYFHQSSDTAVSATVTVRAGTTVLPMSIYPLNQPATTPPPPNENFQAVQNPDGSRTMTWDDVSDENHFTALYSSDADGNIWAVGVAPGDAESFTVPAPVLRNLP